MKYNRRDFLKISYSASMGLMIGVALPVKNRLLGENLVQETFDPNIWISIQSNNIIWNALFIYMLLETLEVENK